jgi:hypothetical protein
MDAERRDDDRQAQPGNNEPMRDVAPSTGDPGRDQRSEVMGRDEATPLLANEDSRTFLLRWKAIQTKFVDEPHRSVREADELVAELMNKLAAEFSDARSDLESRWEREDDVSTEDLRTTLQRYRSFFKRLLAA